MTCAPSLCATAEGARHLLNALSAPRAQHGTTCRMHDAKGCLHARTPGMGIARTYWADEMRIATARDMPFDMLACLHGRLNAYAAYMLHFTAPSLGGLTSRQTSIPSPQWTRCRVAEGAPAQGAPTGLRLALPGPPSREALRISLPSGGCTSGKGRVPEGRSRPNPQFFSFRPPPSIFSFL